MIINGLKISYKILGEGRPLLILHGWGSKSDNWQRVGELLAQKGIKVIIPDLPGFGQSDKPPTAWNLDDYCDFIEEFVRSLNLEKFYLLGHSFGGALAVKCGLKFPEKIDKLFLVNAACFRKKTIKKKILFIIAKIFKPLSFSFLKRIIYRKSDYLSVKGTMKEIYLKVIKENLSNVLEKIEVPTIIIWGNKDKITPIKQAYLIKSKIKDSKLKIIPDANHDLNIKNPEELADVILNEVKDPVELPRDSSPTAQNDNAL